MTDLDSAGLSAAEKALELLHHREPHPLRSSAVREVVRAYLAALSVPSDTEKPRPSPDDYREAVVALADSPEQRTAFLRLIDDVFAAGRAAATPDPPTGHPVKYKHGSPVISDDPAAASPDERLREALDAAALTAAGQNMANTLERNCPCYCDHPLRAGLPPCSRCSSLAAWRAVTGSSEPRKETT